MRRVAVALVTAALIAGAVAAAAPANAHSGIVASTPEEGEVLTELPAEFSVTANETLLDLGGEGAFALQIRDEGGLYYGNGCVRVVDETMSADAAIGPRGAYTMLWQVVSADGHPVSGEITFTWDPPADIDADPGASTAPMCGRETGASQPPPDAGTLAGLPIVVTIAGILVAGAVVIAIVARVQMRRRTRSDGPSA
jgi:methionine-rich copper-binding protein CopC